LDSCENAAKRKIANALWFSLMLAGNCRQADGCFTFIHERRLIWNN